MFRVPCPYMDLDFSDIQAENLNNRAGRLFAQHAILTIEISEQKIKEQVRVYLKKKQKHYIEEKLKELCSESVLSDDSFAVEKVENAG